MDARIEAGKVYDDKKYGIIELEIEDGYHAGTTIMVSLDEDGAPVVQIDTPEGTETHEVIRVHLNDSTASWGA